jgi:hypothetical protein
MQRILADMPLNEKHARKYAYDIIRRDLGSTPYPGKPRLENGTWVVPIHVKYPRILSDKTGEIPEKARFMNFENVGEIRIDATKGSMMDRSSYYDVRSAIQEQLEKVRTTVEMALVKVGANRFAQLPFPEHMHTPIVDILSWVLLNDKIDISEDLSVIGEVDREKYLQHISVLESTGLIRKSGNLIIPGNSLVEIERDSKTLSEKISHAMAFFFEKGYSFIESIKQVLGPHLAITGFCYEMALEYGEVRHIDYKSIERMILQRYRQELKRIKLPRYLIQLESVGLLEEAKVSGKSVWKAKINIFESIQGEEEILYPIRKFLLKN